MTVHHTIMPADQETLSAWKADMRELPAPDDPLAMTCKEIAAIIGLSVSQTRARLSAGVRTGKYTMVRAYRMDVRGQRQLVPVYKLVEKPSLKKALAKRRAKK